MEKFWDTTGLTTDSPRFYVYKIMKLAFLPLMVGCVNVIFLMLFSFSLVTIVIVLLLSFVTFWFVRLSVTNAGNASNQKVTEMISKLAFDGETVEIFQKDLLLDMEYRERAAIFRTYLASGRVAYIAILVLIVLVVFITALPLYFLSLVVMIPWIGLAIDVADFAHSIAVNDAEISLNGSLKKLYNMDTMNTRRG